MECYKDRISYYVSWVNIDNTENGSDVTGGHMYNITGLVGSQSSQEATVDPVGEWVFVIVYNLYPTGQ